MHTYMYAHSCYPLQISTRLSLASAYADLPTPQTTGEPAVTQVQASWHGCVDYIFFGHLSSLSSSSSPSWGLECLGAVERPGFKFTHETQAHRASFTVLPNQWLLLDTPHSFI